MLPLRLVGIRMADDASDTIGGGTKNFLGAVAFTVILVGGEELGREILTGKATSPWWLSLGLIFVGYPIYVLPAIWKWMRGNEGDSSPALSGHDLRTALLPAAPAPIEARPGTQ